MDKKTKILFVKNITRSFTENDIESLQKHFDVRVVDFVLSRKNLKGTLTTVLNMVKGIFWADVTFSWFADIHAYIAVRLSKIFRKKSIVVVGGYEVAKVPEIEYGSMLNPNSAHRVKYILENANKILAVSEFNKKEILKCTNSKYVELVYNGVDCDKFKPMGEKDELVITVSWITNSTLKLKGLDTFINAAEYLPNTKFVLIGECVDNSIEQLKLVAPSNVQISDGKPLRWYQKSKVYCQLSYRESFGVALAEAMSCECVPVVTNNAALPEVVGNTGFHVPYGDPKATAEAIKEALESDKGIEARERIKTMFAINRRERELIRIIKKR